jgi:HD-like signal output (HDOD) protein
MWKRLRILFSTADHEKPAKPNRSGRSAGARLEKLVKSKESLQLSRLIASEWGFPANVVQAIEDQTTKSASAKMSALEAVVHVATLMSRLQILIEEQRVEDDLTQLACCTEFRLTEHCIKCFAELQRYAA